MKKIKFILPSIITLLLLLIIFDFNNLYPFDNNSIVKVDADYQFIPILYHIYDFLHGDASIIYNDIGLGNNIYISMIIQGSIFSPLSMLLYFTDRGNIVNYFNIIIIVKMCLLSLTSYIYINSAYKVKEYYKIIFSVLYAFSGWVLLNYFNVMWLDSVILFPLIVMFLNKMLDSGKCLGYIITLSLSLIISYYISYFILLFILFYSFLYTFLKIDKDKSKKVIFKLGISTLIAILISSFSLLPTLYQTFISSRIDNSYSSSIISNFMNKSLFLMLSTIFLLFFIKLMFKYKDDKKNVYIYFILFLLFGIGLFVEPINLAIHMGSYWSFPYRYSFITLFILMNGSLYYISKYGIKGYDNIQYFRFVIFILLSIGLIVINNIYYKDIIDGMIILDFKDIEIYKYILLIFIFLVFIIFVSLSFRNKYLKYISFSVVCLLQIFIYSSWCMYYADGYYLSKYSNDIYNNIDFKNDEFFRYKMGYNNYTPDYGFIYNVNTLDNWLHILPNKQIDIYKRLGYGNTDTCVRSYGGTIFSDWLFTVGYLLDDEEINNDMFNLVDSYNEYNLYKYNYSNSFGIIYDGSNVDSVNVDELKGFLLHNKIYRDLINKDYDIIKIDQYRYDVVDNKVILNYEIDNNGFLYLELDDELDYLKVNNKYIEIDNNSYIIDLGLYDDDVSIELGINDLDYINFSLGFIKYDDIIKIDSSKIDNIVKLDNGYDISLNNEIDNGYLFLPINNIRGLNVYVNDKEVKIDSYMDNPKSII